MSFAGFIFTGFRGFSGRGALCRLDCLARLYSVRTSSPSSELEDNIVRLIPQSRNPRPCSRTTTSKKIEKTFNNGTRDVKNLAF